MNKTVCTDSTLGKKHQAEWTEAAKTLPNEQTTKEMRIVL
jgi:hypothetical protein